MCRFSEGKLSNIENGKVPVKMFDVAGMCRVYGAARDLEDELIRMADKADEPGWWESYSTSMLKDFSVLLELEVTSKRLLQYEGELIPGLLQTEAYALAVQAADPLMDESEAEGAVSLRTERQNRFWSRSPFPDVAFLIHESALLRPVCGGTGDDEQRARLLEAAKKADIRVVPHSVGAHPSMKGSYSLIDSGIEEISDVVYLESLTGCRYEEDERTLSAYRAYFEATRNVSVAIGDFWK